MSLHFTQIESSEPCLGWVTVVHGILGSGGNLRSVARGLSRSFPQFSFLLPDLRAHGSSSSGTGPHTVEACGMDLLALESGLSAPVVARIGHSFGGKVVLSMAGHSLCTTVLMDTVPFAAEPQCESISWMRGLLERLQSIPVPLEKRADLEEALGVYALNPGFVGWMGTNLKAEETGGYGWKPNLSVVRTLIESYWELDLREHLLGSRDTHILYGARSERFTKAILEEIQGVSDSQLHRIENAGHWLHVDNPAGTLEALQRALSGK